MWETIERMTDDRLWVYTAIAGSIFSALFIAYMRDTKIALWLFGKWDWLLDSIRDRYGWTWFDQDPDAWKSINPNIARKIEDLDARLLKLESKKK
ncbi:MAG: hypothetical protein ACKVJK_07560 [Methylophagaceae bacterium]|jgi:hypothetical protein|tara:strand:+ start:186 stop:470 length:285 start_codon:yes stop_codon:yes gene_type:complete